MLTTGEARRVKCGWLCYFEAHAMTHEGFHFLIDVAPRLPLLGLRPSRKWQQKEKVNKLSRLEGMRGMRLSAKREQESKSVSKITRLLMTSRRGSTLSDSKRARASIDKRERERTRTILLRNWCCSP